MSLFGNFIVNDNFQHIFNYNSLLLSQWKLIFLIFIFKSQPQNYIKNKNTFDFLKWSSEFYPFYIYKKCFNFFPVAIVIIDFVKGQHKKAGGCLCCLCNQRRAALKRPKILEQVNSRDNASPLNIIF